MAVNEAQQNLSLLQEAINNATPGQGGIGTSGGLITGPLINMLTAGSRRRAAELAQTNREGAAQQEVGASRVDPTTVPDDVVGLLANPDPNRQAAGRADLQELQLEGENRELGKALLDMSGVDMTPFKPEIINGTVDALADPRTRDAALTRLGEISQRQNPSPAAALQMDRDRLALRRERLEFAALGGIDEELTSNMANQLRDERRADLAPIRASLQIGQEVAGLLTSGNRSGAVSFAAMYRWIQSQDGSVVRAEDKNTFVGGQGLYRSLVLQLNEAQGEGFIDEPLAQQMLESVNIVAEQQQQALEDINGMHDRQAASFLDTFGPGGTGQVPANFLDLTGRAATRNFDFDPPTNGVVEPPPPSGAIIVPTAPAFLPGETSGERAERIIQERQEGG